MGERWRAQDVLNLAESNAVQVKIALERARSDLDAGLPSGHGDGRRSLNDDGTPQSRVQVLALSGTLNRDPVLHSLHRLMTHLKATRKELKFLCGLDSKDAQRMLMPAGQGFCANPACGRWVSGSRNDRLRSGRCERCRQHRIRHDGQEWQPARGADGEQPSA